jgi:nitrous oxide reductase accessory protein NosL
MHRIPLTALLIAMVGCQPGPLQPVEIESYDMCTSCRMAISQKQFAAQVFDAAEDVHKFDDIACARRFLGRQSGTPAAVFVADYEKQSWMPAFTAFFVRTDKVDTPMGGGLLAFSERARADRAAQRFGAAVLTAEQIGLR